MSMPTGREVSLYVRAADLELWQRAVDYAAAHRMPVSGLVLVALERYLADRPTANRDDRAP